jgi:hypothetical protein
MVKWGEVKSLGWIGPKIIDRIIMDIVTMEMVEVEDTRNPGIIIIDVIGLNNVKYFVFECCKKKNCTLLIWHYIYT